MISYFVGWRGD